MHAVKFVNDDQLPDGHDFMLIDIPDGGLAFYRGSAMSPETLEGSWAAYRALTGSGDRTPSQQTPFLALAAAH